MSDADPELPESFTWAESDAETRTTWVRIAVATVVTGLIIGVLVAISGTILLRIFG